MNESRQGKLSTAKTVNISKAESLGFTHIYIPDTKYNAVHIECLIHGFEK